MTECLFTVISIVTLTRRNFGIECTEADVHVYNVAVDREFLLWLCTVLCYIKHCAVYSLGILFELLLM